MLRLPTVIFARTCAFLTVNDLRKVAQLNRQSHEIFKDDDLWVGLLRERFHYNVSDMKVPNSAARSTYCKFDSGLRHSVFFVSAPSTDHPPYITMILSLFV